MGRFRRFSIREWKGLNEGESPFELEKGELLIARNVWQRGGAIGTRPGTEREGSGEDYNARISGNHAIQGIHEFRRALDVSRTLVVVANGDIYSDDSTIVTSAGITITADPTTGGLDNRWTFAEHADALYAAGGADGDNVWRWTGSGAAAVVIFRNAAAGDIDAKYIFQKWNRGFLGGMNGTDPEDNGMVVRYSALNDMTTWPVANTFGGTSAIGGLSSYGDEFITGFSEFTDNEGDWLLVLTNKRIYSVTETTDPFNPFFVGRRGAIANGCVHQRAFVSLGLDSGDAIYLSRHGIHSLRQSQQFGSKEDRFLSWKIRVTFDNLNHTRLAQTVGAYWKEQGLILFAVPSGSNLTNDTILALDVKGVREITAETARWYIWHLGGSSAAIRSIVSMVPVRDPTNNLWHIYAGNEFGDVFRLARDVTSDFDGPAGYAVEFQTHDDDAEAPGVRKGLGDVYVALQPGGDYSPTLRVVYDHGRRTSTQKPLNMPFSTALWDQATWDVDEWSIENPTVRDKVYGTGSGDAFAFNFSHTGAGEPFYVSSLDYQLRAIGETADIGGV